MYQGICDAIHRELEALEEKYDGGSQMSGNDIENIDKMTHTLKSLYAIEAMKGYEPRRRRYEEYRRY